MEIYQPDEILMILERFLEYFVIENP